MHFLFKDHLGYTTYVRCILPYCESISQHHIWKVAMEHGAQWDKGSRGSMGQLGHIGTGVPMCPAVSQCAPMFNVTI